MPDIKPPEPLHNPT